MQKMPLPRAGSPVAPNRPQAIKQMTSLDPSGNVRGPDLHRAGHAYHWALGAGAGLRVPGGGGNVSIIDIMTTLAITLVCSFYAKREVNLGAAMQGPGTEVPQYAMWPWPGGFAGGANPPSSVPAGMDLPDDTQGGAQIGSKHAARRHLCASCAGSESLLQSALEALDVAGPAALVVDPSRGAT